MNSIQGGVPKVLNRYYVSKSEDPSTNLQLGDPVPNCMLDRKCPPTVQLACICLMSCQRHGSPTQLTKYALPIPWIRLRLDAFLVLFAWYVLSKTNEI